VKDLEEIAFKDTLWTEEARRFCRFHFLDNPIANAEEIISNVHSHVIGLRIQNKVTHYLVYEVEGVTAVIIALFKTDIPSKLNLFEVMERMKPYFKKLGLERVRFNTRNKTIAKAALKKGCDLFSLTFIKEL
jgi:hypothetical protein